MLLVIIALILSESTAVNISLQWPSCNECNHKLNPMGFTVMGHDLKPTDIRQE